MNLIEHPGLIWIKTTDKLPPPNKNVVVWHKTGSTTPRGGHQPGIAIASYRSKVDEFRVSGANYDCRNEIEYWMDIPEPNPCV